VAAHRQAPPAVHLAHSMSMPHAPSGSALLSPHSPHRVPPSMSPSYNSLLEFAEASIQVTAGCGVLQGMQQMQRHVCPAAGCRSCSARPLKRRTMVVHAYGVCTCIKNRKQFKGHLMGWLLQPIKHVYGVCICIKDRAPSMAAAPGPCQMSGPEGGTWVWFATCSACVGETMGVDPYSAQMA